MGVVPPRAMVKFSSKGQSRTDPAVSPEESIPGFPDATPVAPPPIDELQDAAMMGRVAERLFGDTNESVRVGRFVLGSVVGSGAMGVVHAGYDDTLDRKVALKLILEEYTRSEEAHARLLREAQAMARVSHPNVVPVYEAGSYPGGVFVAMEFVEGSTLREWIASNRELGWRRKLDVLLGAGRGLAAAHGEGIVHRDFKPDNVMVTERGEAKVGDFGLAGLTQSPTRPDKDAQTLSAGLTQTGSLLGTPIYMSPEQFDAKPATAQSDQFSFCVVAFEMLFGTRPFAGKTAADLHANVTGGILSPPPSSTRIPRYIKNAILRGLATNPTDRWPSMDMLLASLAPRSRGRTKIALVAVATAGAAAVGVYATRDEPCTGAQSHLGSVWSPTRSAAIENAFEQVGTEFARNVWKRAAPRIGRYADAWVEMHTRNCEMTRLYAEQSEAVMDLRMACLQQAKFGLAASLDVLAEPDTDVVTNTHRLVTALPDLTHCEDVEALQREGSPPSASDAARVEEIEGLVATSRALETAGKFDEAAATAIAARGVLEEVDYGPVATRVLLALGSAQLALQQHDEAERSFLDAQRSAMRNAQWDDAIEASGQVAFVIGARGKRFEEAHLAIDLVQGLADRSASPKISALLRSRLAGVLSTEGRYADAIAAYEASLAEWNGSQESGDEGRPGARRSLAIAFLRADRFPEAEEQIREALRWMVAALGDEHPDIAQGHQTLANILAEQGRHDEARVEYETAVQMAEATMPGHPEVAIIAVSAIAVALRQGDYDQTIERCAALLDTWEPQLGPDHEAILAARSNLAAALMSQGRFEEARRQMQEVSECRRRTLGEDHPESISARANLGAVFLNEGDLGAAESEFRGAIEAATRSGLTTALVGRLHSNLATALADQGRLEEALVAYEAALEAGVAKLGPDHLAVAEVRNNIATVFLEQGRFDDANRELTEAMRIWGATLPEDHPNIAQGLLNLARVEMATGELSAARSRLERAVSIVEAGSGAPADRGETRFALAKCLQALRSDSARQAALANAALDDYADVPAAISKPPIAAIEAFMHEHGIERVQVGAM